MSADGTVLPMTIGTGGMPPRQPLDMPLQDLRGVARTVHDRAGPRVRMARLITFGGAAFLTGFGLYEMIQVVLVGEMTVLEGILAGFFAVTFGWISLAATSAIAGLAVPPARHRRTPDGPLTTLTALVVPVYLEDAKRIAAAIEAMARDLHRLGQAKGFEVVILSDSTDADAWIGETQAFGRLAARLTGVAPVWYRRRWANTAKKAGNIKDFVENWGGRYDHMLVLDADSLMSGETLVALAASMEADRGLGLLQTVPVLAGGSSLFARLQQFAARVHGPVVAEGLAAWQGSDGNFWGHNAIIRTRAFAQSCGLPTLPGRKPFGGPILSHDFVEAALMRRAGWRVEMASRLLGSWEECPPSLIDAAIRDRRWAQGNLQHLKVIGASGLAMPNRIHMGMGVMSYAISLLWLSLIVCGFALAVQAHVIRPEYFTAEFQLFPSWPRFDSERMIRLFFITLAILFLPKLLGIIRALTVREIRAGCGGAGQIIASFFAEILVSALYAPIMMLIHSRQIYEIITGQDAGWSAQRRGAGGTSWRDAWRRHRWHLAIGIAMGIGAGFLSTGILAWLSPTLAGLVLAVPLSMASGSTRIGRAFRRLGLLVIPEEIRPPAIFHRREAHLREYGAMREDGLRALAIDETTRSRHFAFVAPFQRRRGAPDPAHLTAERKIAEAESLDEVLQWLNKPERIQVAGDIALAEKLASLGAPPVPRIAEAATG